jgi:hypothetical protein
VFKGQAHPLNAEGAHLAREGGQSRLRIHLKEGQFRRHAISRGFALKPSRPVGKRGGIQALFGTVGGFTQITGLPVVVVFKSPGPWVTVKTTG